MAVDSFSLKADRYISELLRKENRNKLETYRFTGSRNLVYHVPIPDTNEFVVVKLLPPRMTDYRLILKRPLRNLLYGEREVASGRQRARLEVERYREWQAAGLPVPPLVESANPDVRIIQGLPFPTFYSILGEMDLSLEQRLTALKTVSASLAVQHETARKRGNPGLVHRDPGPWNIMVDPVHQKVYWFDLEYPHQNPGMSIEDLCVRGLRIFVFGVLDHLSNHFELAMQKLARAYEPKTTLLLLADNLEASAHGLPMRVANKLGKRKGRRDQQLRIAAKLRELVPAASASGPAHFPP